MAKEVIMPKLGLTMEEGVINKWFVREGERVEKGDPLFEVATDKVNMEVESPASGVVLKILYPEGATVPITEVVAYIGEEGEEVPVPGKKAPGEQPEAGERVAGEQVMTQKTETGTETAKERIKASPLARKLAQEYGIDLQPSPVRVLGVVSSKKTLSGQREHLRRRKSRKSPWWKRHR